MSDDHSPGDARKPYSDQGGPQGRHAQTHDVRREQVTNPKGPEPEDTSFADQMAQDTTGNPGGHADETNPAVEDKVLHHTLSRLDNDELARLDVIEPGTQLEQGGTYLDLNMIEKGPFKALGGHAAAPSERLIAKRDTDYLIWNRLVGQDAEPDIERPAQSG
jgi:hypothetical protein